MEFSLPNNWRAGKYLLEIHIYSISLKKQQIVVSQTETSNSWFQIFIDLLYVKMLFFIELPHHFLSLPPAKFINNDSSLISHIFEAQACYPLTISQVSTGKWQCPSRKIVSRRKSSQSLSYVSRSNVKQKIKYCLYFMTLLSFALRISPSWDVFSLLQQQLQQQQQQQPQQQQQQQPAPTTDAAKSDVQKYRNLVRVFLYWIYWVYTKYCPEYLPSKTCGLLASLYAKLALGCLV